MANNFFTILSFFYSLMLVIIYFRRKNIRSLETKTYSRIVIANFLNVIFAILCYFTILYKDNLSIINEFVSQTLLLFFITWELFFTFYIIVIINKDDTRVVQTLKKLKVLIGILYFALIATVYYLPLYYHNENKIVYSYGPSANLIYVLTGILIFIWIILIIKNIDILKSKKSIPVVLFIFLTIIVVIIQKQKPGLLLITATETFITIIMYFTIENPDMKLLKEMHEAKEISDNANEEKTLFLYNMTQEIRATTKNIDNEADIIIDSDDIDTDKESARNIKGETSKFRMMTNDILDVSAIDSSNIKIYNSSYNLKMLLRTIISSYTDICHNKNLEFRTNIDHSIPESLYGDNISLKKAINLLLTYSVKSTKKGYVELDINTIIKNDIVRLIITIEDSSMGIKSSDLEKIKIDNKNISESYKLITLMNGTMVLTSNYGSGNKIKIILDQKIDKTPNKEEKKYQSILEDKKILIIDNSEPSIKIIEKLLKGSNINIDYSLNGRDAYNKIKTRNRYDLILLDEELNTISGYEMLKNLQGIRNFNIPVILLSKDNKYEYNEEYLKMGFSDILIKPLSKEILLEKINKNIINRVDILENNKEISK